MKTLLCCKRKVTLSFLLFFSFFSGYSRVKQHIDESKMNKSVEEYYKLVNAAEINIIKEDFSSALILYKEAFTINKLDKDLVNAFLCSYIINDKENLEELGDFLCENGLDFDQQFLQCKDKLFRDYLRKYKNCTSKLDSNLILFVDTLFYRDQITRSDIYGKNQLNYFDSIDIYDSTNKSQVIQHCSNKLLNFESAGFSYNRGLVLDISSPIILVFHHHRGKEEPNLDSILYGSLLSGSLNPELLAGLWLHRNAKLLGLDYKLADSLGLQIWNYPHWSCESINTFNQNREKYFLPTCKDSYNKYQYFLDMKNDSSLYGQFCILRTGFEILESQGIIFD